MKRLKSLSNLSKLYSENRAYFLLILLLIFSIFQYSIERIYVFFLYPDEFGYWSSAATFLGWDWKEVSSLGSFYSFGYSLCLLPLLKLIPSAPETYRGAIMVNVLLMCLAFFLVIKMAEEFLPRSRKKIHVLFAGVCIFYPAWIFHLQFTTTEGMLFFLFVLAVFLTNSFLERPKVLTALGLALVCGYGYMVHMRFVGVAAACVLTIVLWVIFQSGNWKKLLLMAIALAGVFALAFFLKELVKETVYSDAGEELLKRNEFGGQLGKINYLLTKEGAIQLVKNLSGKVLYMGTSSLGLFYYGFFWCLQELRGMVLQLGRGEKLSPKGFLSVFMFLAVAAELAIGSVYSIQNKDLDWIIYGRYSEFVLPAVMMAGMCWIYRKKRRVLIGILAWACHTVVSMICVISFLNEPVQKIRGYMSVGLSFLAKKEEVEPVMYLFQAWLFGTVLLFVVSLCINLTRKKSSRAWLLGIVLAGEIFLGLEASHKYIYPVNEYMRYELHLGDYVLEEMEDAEVMYLREERTQWIDVLQMQLRDRPIQVISLEELDQISKEGTALIVHKDGAYRQEAQKRYTKCKEYNIFCLYYN